MVAKHTKVFIAYSSFSQSVKAVLSLWPQVSTFIACLGNPYPADMKGYCLLGKDTFDDNETTEAPPCLGDCCQAASRLCDAPHGQRSSGGLVRVGGERFHPGSLAGPVWRDEFSSLWPSIPRPRHCCCPQTRPRKCYARRALRADQKTLDNCVRPCVTGKRL